MKTNDCLRRLRYILALDDAAMMATFADGELSVTREQVSNWLKRDDDPSWQICLDQELASFLNGLIIRKRGRRPGPPVAAEARLTNNIVLKKLKIAFSLEADEILKLLAQQSVNLSKHELSAFFRKPNHRHYRECKDQVLRNLLSALQRKLRPDDRTTGDAPQTNFSAEEFPASATSASKQPGPEPQDPWARAQSKRSKPS